MAPNMGKNIVVIAIEAGEPIPENLGCKIQRPLPICAGLTVRFCDDWQRPLYRSLRNMVFDQLTHASIARSI